MFNKPNYLVKEHAKILKVTDRYDIVDPETGGVVAYAKEEISGFKKFMRWIIAKSLMGTVIEIRNAADDSVIYKMNKPGSIFRATVTIFDKAERKIGYFKSRILTLGGALDVYSANDAKVAEVKGNWTGWNFKFTNTKGEEIGQVTKKWGGVGKELFTTADNYMISINPDLQGNQDMMALLIMAGLAMDLVYKEKNN